MENINPENKPDITMFFPAYNEEQNIPIIINSAEQVLKKFAQNYEILVVVYEGSKDNSIQIVKDFEKNNRNVRLVLQPKDRKGIGEAIKIGFKGARYPYIFYADSDNQFDLNEFEKFLPYLKDYDIIAGYRLKRNDPFTRIWVSRIYNVLVSMLFGTKERDLDCAFRLVKKDVLDSINLMCRTGLGTTEILAKARLMGFKIKEIGVNHYPRKFGTPVFEGRFLNVPKLSVVRELVREMILLRRDIKSIKKGVILKSE